MEHDVELVARGDGGWWVLWTAEHPQARVDVGPAVIDGQVVEVAYVEIVGVLEGERGEEYSDPSV